MFFPVFSCSMMNVTRPTIFWKPGSHANPSVGAITDLELRCIVTVACFQPVAGMVKSQQPAFTSIRSGVCRRQAAPLRSPVPLAEA